MSSDLIQLSLKFPLPDGRALVQGPLRYNADGLATRHNADFMQDPTFSESYRLALATGHVFGPDLHIEWRIYTACWIAQNALRVDGDFVECGVASGMISRAITHYVGWEGHLERTLWLLDTFAGFPDAQTSGFGTESSHYDRSLDRVRQTFSSFTNVRIVPGVIPSTLPLVSSTQIAYLHIDLNSAEPEVACIEHLWSRLSAGAWVLLDDYGWTECIAQKRAIDVFAGTKGVRIFSMPTGQGILIKP